MQEVIDNIVEKVNFKNRQSLVELLSKCLYKSFGLTKSTSDKKDNVIFKVDLFFAGCSSFINEYGKDKKYIAGVEVLNAICEEIGIEMEKEECFILIHLRNLGKYRMREEKLYEELKLEWKQYGNYVLSDQDFSYALKNLMRKKFIIYRKRNLYLKKSVVIRYRK